jgi:hypothetical protein
MKSAIKLTEFKKIPSYTILLSVICFSIIVSLVFISFNKRQISERKYTPLSSFSCDNIHTSILPPAASNYTIIAQSTSPDGTKQVTFKSSREETFQPKGAKDKVQYIWQKVVLTGTAVSHPIDLVNQQVFGYASGNDFNSVSWSPDSRYFYYLKSSIHGGNVLIFRTDGAQFSNKRCYLIGTDLTTGAKHDDNGIDTPYSFDLIGEIKWLNNSQIQFHTSPDLPPGTNFGSKLKYLLDVEKETLQSSRL